MYGQLKQLTLRGFDSALFYTLFKLSLEGRLGQAKYLSHLKILQWLGL